jgi:hypothetical protein
MNDLVRLTDKADPKSEDLQRLRARLDENDYLVRLNEVSEQAFNRVTNSLTNSELVKEMFRRQIESKRKGLDYETENVMVKMLIDQVILCHIRLNTFEAFHAEKVKEITTVSSGLYYDKLLTSYQRRLQRACESLAKVKRVLSEANLLDQKARNKRTQSTLASAKLNRALSD